MKNPTTTTKKKKKNPYLREDAGSLDLSIGLEVGGRERSLTLSAMVDVLQ